MAICVPNFRKSHNEHVIYKFNNKIWYRTPTTGSGFYTCPNLAGILIARESAGNFFGVLLLLCYDFELPIWDTPLAYFRQLPDI